MNQVTISKASGDKDELYGYFFKCPDCNSDLVLDEAKYCSECGAKINWTL